MLTEFLEILVLWFFFFIPRPMRKYKIMALHKFLSVVALVCFSPFHKVHVPVLRFIYTISSDKWLDIFPFIFWFQYTLWGLSFPTPLFNVWPWNFSLYFWFWIEMFFLWLFSYDYLFPSFLHLRNFQYPYIEPYYA